MAGRNIAPPGANVWDDVSAGGGYGGPHPAGGGHGGPQAAPRAPPHAPHAPYGAGPPGHAMHDDGRGDPHYPPGPEAGRPSEYDSACTPADPGDARETAQCLPVASR
mmetsp:Transcript_32661/g.104104  ORF Transcript_32661/g.104104 Transcript_32661/m.104104 type:complete len:107 (-) Transcript_32661:399-719(-)